MAKRHPLGIGRILTLSGVACVFKYEISESISHSVLSDSLRLSGMSMGFSRQEYWSGLPFPSPGDLPSPGVEPGSLLLQADSLPPEPPGKSIKHNTTTQICRETVANNSINLLLRKGIPQSF